MRHRQGITHLLFQEGAVVRASLVVVFSTFFLLAGCPAESPGNGGANGAGNGGGVAQPDAGTLGSDGGSPTDSGSADDSGIPADAGVAAGVDAQASTLSADPTTGMEANGVDQSILTISVVDTNGNPMANANVVLSSEPSVGLALTQPFPTDSNGVTVAYISATIPSAYVISAAVGPDGSAITLNSTITLEFSTCVSKERMYQDLQGPVFSQCIGCHNAYGRAAEFQAYTLRFPDDPDAPVENVATLSTLTFPFLTDSGENMPFLIAKPTGGTDHFGGVVLQAGDPAIDQLHAFVQRLDDDTVCPEEEPVDMLSAVEFMNATATLRKATFALTGRFPDAAEMDAFSGGEGDLPDAIDALMTEDGFYDRIMELYNDILLTDEALPGARALNRLNATDFPDRFYFRPCDEVSGSQCCPSGSCCKDDPGNSAEFCAGGKSWSNESVGKEPLQLIRHIVENDRPFTEILTADYIMVNPYSARVYGAAASFDGDQGNDRYEYVEGSLSPSANNGLAAAPPYAGLLTSQIFLRRYPTTRTNVNRHRARNVYSKFLGVDIMSFLQLVIDQTEDRGEDPFMDARTCSACHAALDPVAGTFKNYRNGARYDPFNWYDDMRMPGFNGEAMTQDDDNSSLAWLGGKLVEDTRFSLAIVQQVYTLVTGHVPVAVPTESVRSDFQAQYLAHEEQTAYLEEVRQRFVASNHNLKSLVKDIVLGPYFRAGRLTGTVDPLVEEALTIAGVGMGRVLTPEQLNRKINDVLGYPYKANGANSGTTLLLNTSRYQLLLGGIDSDVTTVRFREPYPIMSNIARRMANELACLVVPQDFSIRDRNSRRLFRHVEITTVPEDENGAALNLAQTNIREDLKALHLALLGESVDDGNPALEESFDLFTEVWRDGKARVDAETEPDNLRYRCRALKDFYSGVDHDAEETDGPNARIVINHDPQYAVRAWMAVTAYLLSDYLFLFE
jgi:hypothetical protein